MRTRTPYAPLATAALLAVIFVASASADFAEWLGPQHNGIVKAENWSPDFLNRNAPRWEKQIGVGYSAPTVVGEHVFLAGWKDGKTHLHAVDLKTGEVRWTYSFLVDQYNRQHQGGPGSTPAVQGNRLFYVSRVGDVHCLDVKTGKVLWVRTLATDLGVEVPYFGFAGSPRILESGLAIDLGRIVLIDPSSGAVKWKTETDYGAGYATPTPFMHDGKLHLACFPYYGLVVVDAATGKELAKKPWANERIAHSATPVVHDSTIFISTHDRGGCSLARFTGNGLEVVWEGKQMNNNMATSILIDGHLYGFDGGRLRCVDWKTGESKWDQRGLGRGALIAVGKDLLILSETGELITAPATPEGFRPTARKQVINDDHCWTYPVFANGSVIARGEDGQVVCFDATPAAQ